MADLPSHIPAESGSAEEKVWISDIFKQHSPAAWFWALQIVGQVCDAENVLQESFLKLLCKARTGTIENPRAYLRVVVRTTALDVLAGKRADALAHAAVPMSEKQNDPAALLQRQELLAQLDAAIAKLPTRLRPRPRNGRPPYI